MNTIQDVSLGLSTEGYEAGQEDYRGECLQEALEDVCTSLGRAGDITGNKADIEFLVNIVAAYMISKKADTLPEDSKPPSYIFDTQLFPILDNSGEVEVEEIEDGSNTDT